MDTEPRRSDPTSLKMPAFAHAPVRTRFAGVFHMLTIVLAGLGAWFVAALVVGVALGKLISAHERSDAWAVDASKPSTPRAA